MTLFERIVVVGGSLAGLRAVEGLRRRGFDGAIIWIGAEPHPPYDRPPLSKQVLLGDWDAERTRFRRGDGYDDLEVDLRLGVRATRVDPRDRVLALSDGQSVPYDGLVIATGARARLFRGTEGLAGVHCLRTLDDALAIRAAFEKSARVVVIGAGFIGLEVAACARARGLEVTIVETLDEPLGETIGGMLGHRIAAMHRDRSVQLLTRRRVDKVEGERHVERVCLSDGTGLSADLVVVGIGVIPETEWLQGSGIDVNDGVVCDAWSATAVPGIVAAGDVARWYNPLFEETMRVEHWTNAVEQANVAVGRLLDGQDAAKPHQSVPYFWSDQYDCKIQFAGRVRPTDAVHVVDGSLETEQFVALYSRNGKLTGALALNRPAQLIKYRRLIAERPEVATVLPT